MADKGLQIQAETIVKMRYSPLFFVQTMWGLQPQPIRSEFKELVEGALKGGEF